MLSDMERTMQFENILTTIEETVVRMEKRLEIVIRTHPDTKDIIKREIGTVKESIEKGRHDLFESITSNGTSPSKQIPVNGYHEKVPNVRAPKKPKFEPMDYNAHEDCPLNILRPPLPDTNHSQRVLSSNRPPPPAPLATNPDVSSRFASDENYWVRVVDVVVSSIGRDWKALFRELYSPNFIDTENIIQDIEYKHSRSLREQCRESMVQLRLLRSDLTVPDLIRGLRRCNLNLIADMVSEIRPY